MTLKLRHLRLRAVTADGPYGADVPFGEGLNVLWADNTKGKSMCMQGMLYALGLERMLSPKREIPLPHAMTTYLETDDNNKVKIVESAISLEIENGAGQIITVNRGVTTNADYRLITVDFGPALTRSDDKFRQQNFFVLDGGAAIREDGFHHFLEGFLGWQLPQVRRYDAPETKLYLETIFPLFWVEQKYGWSSIPAAIPTYMRIREVQKRAVEFINDLDVHGYEMQRERLREQLIAIVKEWQVVNEELVRHVVRDGGVVHAIPEVPVADEGQLDRANIQIWDTDRWIALSTLISRFRVDADRLASQSVPSVENQSSEVAERLQQLIARADDLNSKRVSLFQEQQLKAADVKSLERRIQTLSEDLAKNLDVQKLQRYSGKLLALTPDRCPTCEQALEDTLLAQNSVSAIMPIADNIEYIRSQKRMFEDILLREKADDNERGNLLVSVTRELMDSYSQIRLLRSELSAPGSNPSAAAIEARVRIEARIRDFEALDDVFHQAIQRLRSLQSQYSDNLAQQAMIPKEKLSDSDLKKMSQLTVLLRDQAAQFKFSTFAPDELSISEESYRPEKEGFEIGFETSASDAIRLKWAYQLSLLELAAVAETNHPNLLVFDEPRQQSSSKISFSNLLERAAGSKNSNQQVIFSTSEDMDSLEAALSQLDCHRIVFPGYILQKMQ